MYRTDQQQLGAKFRFGSGEGNPQFRIGSRSSSAGTSTRQANRYESTACPPGQEVVKRDREHRAPKFIGDKNYDDVVFCKPVATTRGPVASPPPAPVTNITTTVSPVLQTQVSPQISPVFSQMQDSPGSTQAATTAQVQPGGMSAEGGGSGGGSMADMMEMMRLQAELDRQERQERQAAEAQRRADEDRRYREQQTAAQAEAQRRADADRAEQLRLQQESEAARAAEAQAQQTAWEQAQAEQQAAYERALEQTPAETPSTFVVTPSVMPGREMIADLPPEPGAVAVAEPGVNWPLIIGGVVLAGGVVLLSTRKKKR